MEEKRGLTVREFARLAGIRSATAYGLVWDGVVSAQKNAAGEWIVDRESVEKYRLSRNLRRLGSRSPVRRGAIDVTTVRAGAGV